MNIQEIKPGYTEFPHGIKVQAVNHNGYTKFKVRGSYHLESSLETARIIAKNNVAMLADCVKHGFGSKNILCPQRGPIMIDVSTGEQIDKCPVLDRYDDAFAPWYN